ncbi:hypothetical protein GCM10009677_61700 [Sphaerisporangium rubeum]|uniref:Phospholipid carrier-dependent glycosyltransferase n=1 Tax=Sphaerisporangium rubeum TaxID=321317 RepID=A0A7X0IB92_9ACTN|nr:hypothetical protein [Sphaerisporangium rubeum]MBB6472031.1 hypothetical protein [Sphaerisporangium rubeum]
MLRRIPAAGRVTRVRRHLAFLVVLSLGVALRAGAMLGYRPALWFPDTYTYVVTALRPRPDLVRPAGYPMFLRLLEPFHDFAVVVLVQHVLGLATGVMIYAAVRRWRAATWAGVAASAPVLLDAYQVQLEHLLVSDTLFMFLLVTAVYVATGTRTWRGAAAAGLLLAAAAVTRTVGLPLIVLVALWLAFRRLPRRGARGTLWPAAACLAAALVPVGAYAAWFSATHHRFGIVGANGVFLYGRAMSFADCAVMRPPPDLAVLCDDTPPEARPPSQAYVWDPGAPLPSLPGITFAESSDRLAGRFAMLALRSQPLDYAASVLGELARGFVWGRPVYPDRVTYDYYEFPAQPPSHPARTPAILGLTLATRDYQRGSVDTRVVEPYAGWTRAYQDVARLPGTVLLVVLLAAPAAAVVRRRRGGPVAAPWTLPWITAVVLLVLPAATAEFDYRYVLPAVPLAFLAAALALTGPSAGRATEKPSLPADSMHNG